LTSQVGALGENTKRRQAKQNIVRVWQANTLAFSLLQPYP